MLRLLKSGTVKSLKDCAPLVGSSLTQLTRWWECYRAEGLTGMLQQHKPVGKASRLTLEAWEGLLVAMRKGHIAMMQDARDDLEREWGIRSKNGKEHGWLFKKHRLLVEDRAQAAQESQCRAAGRLQKNFGSLIKHPKLSRVVALDEGRFGLITWFRRRCSNFP